MEAPTRYTDDLNLRPIEAIEADIERSRVSRINNCKVELGRCSLDELVSLRETGSARLVQVQTELMLVDDEINRRHSPAYLGAAEQEIA